jgi:diaminopimelate decarboxylase
MDACCARFIQEKELIFSKVQTYGSPLNCVFPITVLRNHSSFCSVLNEFQLQGEILFTSKPNKSRSILSALSLKEVPVDVSSEGALRHALSCGIPGRRIQCSGPKSQKYLAAAYCNDTTISIDSLDELDQLCGIVDTHDKKPKVLLRICGFQSDRVQFTPSDAPFGVRRERRDEALLKLARLREVVDFQGIHFHLLSGDKEERLIAFENALEAILYSQTLGLRPTIINIGGGFKVQYAADKEEWQRFQSYLRASMLGKVTPVTWDGTGLGLRAEKGRITGAPAYVDHYPAITGAQMLSDFLSLKSPLFDNYTVAELLRDMMLELRVEPGRAMLDSSGVTVAEIMSVKESACGSPLLMLDMNHTGLLSREQKLLTQPFFLSQEERSPSSQSYFLFGNLCIASDLILYQKVYPGFTPKQGDLVLFANTAAYHMDFAEAEVLHQRPARKLAFFEESEEFHCVEDEAACPEQIMRFL